MSNSGEKLSRRQQLKTRLLDDMKVTTFVTLQSQNLKNVRLLQKEKIYLFEIQSNPNLNLNIVVTNKIEHWGGLPLPLAVYVRMAHELSIYVYIYPHEKLAEHLIKKA